MDQQAWEFVARMEANKVLAETGTTAARNPAFRSHVFQAGQGSGLAWLGLAAGVVLLVVLFWSLFFR